MTCESAMFGKCGQRSFPKYSVCFPVYNATYMCGKAISLNEGSIESGCYSQYVNGYEIKACVCKSIAHEYQRPCNAADINKISVFLILIVGFYNFVFI